MPFPPSGRRASRTAVGALSAAALIALGAAPAAFAEEAAPDLVLGAIAPIDGVRPGSSFEVPVEVSNKGTAAEKAWVYYSVTRGLDYADVPSNCATHQVSSYDEMTAKWNVVCEFDQVVEPGVVYTPEKPLAVKALDRALHDDLRISVWDYEPPLDDAATQPVQGTAPAVRLVEQTDGGEGVDSAVDVPVTSVNTADFQVTGAHLKGRVGDTVSLEVKFTNAGPAWVQREEETSIVTVLVTPPAGTSVVKAYGYCAEEGKAYVCGTSQRWEDEGKGETYTFKLKIDKKVSGAKGSVALKAEERPFDPDKANDKAEITLAVTGGGSTGGSGGTSGGTGGASGSAGGSGDATTGGSTSGSSSSGGSASSSTGGSGTDATGGDLASTGSGATLPIAGAAGAALVVGAGAVLIVRRRARRRA